MCPLGCGKKRGSGGCGGKGEEMHPATAFWQSVTSKKIALLGERKNFSSHFFFQIGKKMFDFFSTVEHYCMV